jgi:hypothetical protein
MIRTLFAFLLLCSPVLAQTPAERLRPVEVVDVVEVVNVRDFNAAFAVWAMKQNALAYENAARLRDEVNGDKPSGTVVSHTQVYGWSAGGGGFNNQGFNNNQGSSNQGFNNFSVREFNTFAPGCTPFGGGPVWIINPFCPPAVPAQ